MKWLLALSIVLNVALAAWGFSRQPDHPAPVSTASVTPLAADGPETEYTPFPRAGGDLPGYFKSLLAEGLSHQQTKPLVLAQLKQNHIHSIGRPKDRYWQDNPLAHINYLLAIYQGFEQVRNGLLAIYGAPVRQDPLFTEQFYPLAMQFPFLDSEQQLVVQKVLLDTQKRAVELQMNHPDGIAVLSAEQTPAAILANTLNDQALQEYLLRSSPLAATMRRSGVVFTEASFRRAYTILSRFQRVQTPKEIFQARADIDDLLGTAASTTLWAAIDPTFGSLQKVAARHAIADEQTRLVYDVLLTSNQALSEAAEERQTNPERALQSIQEIVTNRQNELIRLVGERAANDFMTATRVGRTRRLDNPSLVESPGGQGG